MRLGQIEVNGAVSAAIFERGQARPVPGLTMLDLLQRAEAEGVALETLANQLAGGPAEAWKPAIPIHPPEVWGCGCTYETSAAFRDAEHGTREGMYAFVYREARPEVFFKGTARVCVGPGQGIGIRADSRFTAPEPELALVLGSAGRIVGFTLANDVSAWDIERENALYLTQSKVYDACCALGPCILTTGALPDPYGLTMTCTVTRAGSEIFSGAISTSKLHRRLPTLVEYLTRSNHVPCGTVLLTGTGIIVPQGGALAPADVVTIRVAEIGELTNHAVTVG
jgi:2-dehydro-3-deoxy-D-arabinonate dehydratase